MKKFLKEKLKNKFILIIILAILSILWIQYLLKPEIDTNTYVVLVKWEVNIDNNILNSDDRLKLEEWNSIVTKDNSACVVEWWDWSLTRLWENSKIEIQELNVEEDLSKINLQFKLVNWKTRSNVVSFLWEKSYFKQNFEDIEAAVRWTVFDVNLDKDYVYVANHEVAVKKDNETKIIQQNKAFSISKFSFIEIEKFIKNIVDKKWLDKNSELDSKFLDNLKNNISEKINLENIDTMLEKNKTYKELLSEYQKFNFVSASDAELFKIKTKIKRQLIETAPDEEKENLVKYSIYDFQDALKSKNLDSIKNSFSIISENIDIAKKLDFKLDDNFLENTTGEIKNFLSEKASILNNLFWNINIDWFLEDGKKTLNSIKNKADKLRDNFLNSIIK